MNSTKRRLKKVLIVTIVLVAVGALGFMLGKNKAAEDAANNQSASEESIYSDSSDLRKALNIALAEHVALTTETMRASYDNHESSTALVDELDKNSRDIANIVGDFYGEDTETAFLKMWQDHITFFINYTVSAKNDDKEGKDQALSDLEDYSQEAAEFLASLNSSLTTETTKPLLSKHRDLIIATIDDYAEESYPESFDKESQAYGQAGKLGDVLSDGIIKQFPDRFSE